ncbi:MAG: pyridoxal phosphate-dependent aminotransferase [Solirubrobacteraceae bacterium]
MHQPPPALMERLPEQYFARILAGVAAERARPGAPVIDLGRGNPDLPPPPGALAAAQSAVADPALHGYAPFQGEPALREAIAARYAADHGVALDPEREVAVVPGVKTAIMLATLACVERGKAVALPDPGYPDYLSGIAMAGARAITVPLTPGTWQPEWDALDGAEPALVVVNYPSNPTAACEAPGTFEAAVAVARERGAWLISDLAYGFLAFDGRRARSVLEVEGARECAIELWSASKIYGMAGWRLGFVVGNAELVGHIRTLVDHVAAGVPMPLQRGLTAALSGDQGHVAERLAVYARRRELLCGALGVERPEGTFYAWWRLPEGITPERLLREARVAVAPGAGFGARGAGWARLSLAVSDEELVEATGRIGEVLQRSDAA